MSLNPGVTMVAPSRDRRPMVVVMAVFGVLAVLALAFVLGYYLL